jgi:hypothetical protein
MMDDDADSSGSGGSGTECIRHRAGCRISEEQSQAMPMRYIAKPAMAARTMINAMV